MVWGAQLAGTLGIAAAIYFFFGSSGPVIRLDSEWMHYGYMAMLGAAVPALWSLHGFRAFLHADRAAARSRGHRPPRLGDVLRRRNTDRRPCRLP